MSDISRSYKINVSGNAGNLVKQFEKLEDYANNIVALNDKTIAFTFDPTNIKQLEKIKADFQALSKEPARLQIDTEAAKAKVKELEQRVNNINSKSAFSLNGIYGRGKGNSESGYTNDAKQREQLFRELVKEIGITKKEVDKQTKAFVKENNISSDKAIAEKREEITLENQLLTLYKTLATEAKQITSADKWKEDDEAISSLCEKLQTMRDIEERFKAKKTNLLGIDTKEELTSFKTFADEVKQLASDLSEKISKKQRSIVSAEELNAQIATVVSNINSGLNGESVNNSASGATGLNERIEATQTLAGETQNATERIKELNAELKAGSYSTFGKATLPSSVAGINNRTNNIGGFIDNFQQRFDLISSQDVKDAEEVKQALLQINTLEDQINKYSEKVAISGKLNADEAQRFTFSIEAALSRIKELKQGFSDINKELVNSNAQTSSPINNYTRSNGGGIPKGKFSIPSASNSNASSENGNGLNGSGGLGSSGNGVGNNTSPIGNIPPEIPTKLILDTSEAETKLADFKKKAETPVETTVNMVGTIKTDMDIVTTDLKFLTEHAHNVSIGMVSQNEELLDSIATKLRNLKENSNIDVKVATEDLGKTNAKVGVKLPTQKEILGQLNTTLLSVEPKLHKLQLKFKNPIKKDILTPVNDIIKEVKEKVGTIPVKVTYDKNNNSKISSLTNKFEDIAAGAELIGEAFKNSSSVVNASIDKNLPKLYEMWQVTDEIVRCLKTVKGMDLKIKNVTYNSKDGTASTNASKAAKEQKKEAAETVALLKQIEKAKTQLEKSEKNSGLNEYQQLKAKVDAVSNAYKNLPLDKQKALTEEIRKQVIALKDAEGEQRKYNSAIQAIAQYKLKSADLDKLNTNEQAGFISQLDDISKKLKDGSITLEDYTKQFAKLKREIKAAATLNTKRNSRTFAFEGSLDDIENKIRSIYGHNNNFQITSEQDPRNSNITKLTASYKDLSGTLHTLRYSYDAALQGAIQLNSVDKESIKWTDKLAGSLKRKSRELLSYLGTFASFYAIMNTIRRGLGIVKEMDDAMTELRKVSQDSVSSIDAFKAKSFELGSEVGATGSIITKAAADWSRLGYSLREASELAKASSVYVNVGDNIDATTATEDLVSTMKAFHMEAEDTIGIVDRLNKVGNEFSIGSNGIGAALKRSSSALETANNDLDQSIAMITAMNEIVQDPENVGNTLKVMSLRIRGASADLKKMQEDEDGLITSTASLQAMIQKLTSVNGQGGVNILEPDNKTFRSTYEIMKDISKVWEQMNDTSQSALLQAIAGKARANGVAALLSNFEQAENALKASQEASGSALAENEKYLDSISGKLSILSNEWSEMWTNAVSSEFSKFLLDVSNGLLKAVNSTNVWITALSTISGILFSMSGKSLTSTFLPLFSGFASFAKNLTSLNGARQNITSIKDLFTSLSSSAKGSFNTLGLIFSPNQSDNQKYRNHVIDGILGSEAFQSKDLSKIQAYIKAQKNLTREFKNQVLAATDVASAEAVVEGERTTESAITTGLIAKEMALKAVRFAVVAGIGIAISALIKYRQEQHRLNEESKKAIISEGQQQSERFASIRKAYESYKELENEQGRVIASEEKLSDVTTALNDALGDKASKLDGLTEGSKAYGKQLDEVYAKEVRNAKHKSDTAYQQFIQTDDVKNVYKNAKDSIMDALAHGVAGLGNEFEGVGLHTSMENGYADASFDKISSMDDLYERYVKACDKSDEYSIKIESLNEQLAVFENRTDDRAIKQTQNLKKQISDLEFMKGVFDKFRGVVGDVTNQYEQIRTAQFTAHSSQQDYDKSSGQYTSKYDMSKASGLQQSMNDFAKESETSLEVVEKLASSAFPNLYAQLMQTSSALDVIKEKTGNETLSLEDLENKLSSSDIAILTNPDFDSSKIDWSIASWDKLAENIHKAVSAYTDAQVASMSFSDILSTQNEAIDDTQKKIATISELYGKAFDPKGLSAGETIDLLQDMNTLFSDIGEDFDISGLDDLNDLDDLLLKLIEDGGWLDKALDKLTISDDLKNQIKEMAAEEIKYKNAIQGATQNMSGLSSAYQTIRTGMDEYAKSGQMTYSTLTSLLQIEPQYLALLQVENGQIGVNSEALQAMVEQQKLEAINATFAAEAETLNAMAQAASAQQAANSATAHAALQEVLMTTAGCYDAITSSALAAAAAEAQAAASNALDAGVSAADIQRVQESFQQMRNDIINMDVSTKKAADKTLGYAKKAGGGTKKTAKETLDKILAELKNAVEDGAITTKEYLDQMKKLTDDYYKKGKITLKEYMDYQRQYYRGVVDMYKEVAAAVQRYFDKQKEGLEDQKEGLQDQIDALQEQQEAQDRIYDKQIKALEREKKALERKKDAFERAYNKEIEKIEKKQHKIELQIRTYEHEKEAIEEIQKAIERQIDELEDQQKIYQQMQKDLERQKQPYEDQKSALEKIIKDIERQQKEIEKQKKVYEDQVKILERSKRVLERQTEELERQKKPLEAQKQFYEKQIKDLEKQEKVFDKQVTAIEKQQKEIEKQKKLLEESKKPYEDQLEILNEQKEALEKANQARQEAINLQKAQYALEQAHEQRTNLILKNGQFVYEADQTAVRDAQEGLRDAEYQKKLKGIDDQIDFNNDKIKDIDKQIKPLTEKNEELQKSIDKIQESIDALKEKMEQWKERSEDVQESIDAIDEKINSVKDSIDGLENQIEDINYNYIQPLEDKNDALSDQITNLNYQVEDLDRELEKFENKIKSIDRNIDDLDAQIEKLNAENERYNELLEPIEDALDRLKKKNDKYGETLDDLKYKLEQITKKYDKQIDKIDRKIDKINEEKDKFDEAIEDQIYELQKAEKEIDKQITKIDRYARQWQRVIDEWQLAKDQKLLEGMFGGNWKERLDSLDPSLIQEFAAGFRQACEDMRKNAEEAAKSIQSLKDVTDGSGGGSGGGGTTPTTKNMNPYGLTHRGGNGDPKQAALDIDEVDSKGLDAFLSKANKDVPKAKDTATSAMKETDESAKKSNKVLDALHDASVKVNKALGLSITAHAATSDSSRKTEAELIKNSNSIKNSVNGASKAVDSSSASITTKSSDASKTVNGNVAKIIDDATKAQTDSDSKTALVGSQWTGLYGLVNTQALGITASSVNAEKNSDSSAKKITSFMEMAQKNTAKAEDEIKKSGAKAQSETTNFMNKVGSETKRGITDAKKGSDDIKKQGSNAESNTKKSMANVKTQYNGAEKDSSNSAKNIKKTGEDAQRTSKEHTNTITKAWEDLKEKVKGIWETISGWLSGIMEKLSSANEAASNVKTPSGTGNTTVQTNSKGGRVRIPVAAKGRRVKLGDNFSANLNAVAHAVGEDVMIAAKEGEGVFTKQQTDDLEELIELTPELINSTKEYARFANLFKSLTVNPTTVQDNIAHNLNGASKGANTNVVNSQTKTISMQIGDVIVQGVENVNDFAAKIKSNLPNAMLQELMATT